MNAPQDDRSAKGRRLEEAANILRRLDEDPADPVAVADKREFLARGDAERRSFALAERAFSAARSGLRAKDRRNKTYGLSLLAAGLVAGGLAWGPASVALRADHRTALHIDRAVLKSGDEVVLDASSAIEDDTDAQTRVVNILRGAGYFDVDRDGRKFVVTAGDVAVQVIGTQFEVSRLNDGVRVGVAEGAVEVRLDGQSVTLTAGQGVLVSDGRLAELEVSPEDVAGWRNAELTLTGLTLAEAASEFERRLPGRVVVIGDELRKTRVGGVLDLSAPENALATLAATSNARVVSSSKFLTILYAR